MLNTMTIPQLKALIADMNLRSVNGDMIIPSKARKADIVAMISEEIERLWDEAKNYNSDHDAAALESYLKKPAKSYNERMASRLNGYYETNGHSAKLSVYRDLDSIYMMSFLTPKQRRRVAKKTGKQYAKLVNNR